MSKWSGRRDLNSGPPAPKPAGLPLGSPSFSISFLKTNELEKYLVVARCTEMWLRMRGVPRILPIAKKRRTAIISQTNFVLSDTDLSAARGYSQNPPQFFRLGPPMPLGPKLPKLPLVIPNTLKWQHLHPSDFGAFGECWKMHLFSD
jgi:hypothetical protein